jgi:ATP-binding cassette subfamily C protein
MYGMAASDRIFSFLNEEEPALKTETLEGTDIELKQVCFSYDGKRSVLKDVDIRIPEGSFIGIAGESGSGKSTIASLIMGRNTAASGSLTIGGRDIGTISEDSLLRSITYVGFGSVFFKGTVRENLLLADRNASDERLWKVLSDCALEDYLKSEKGLDTQLLENAANLSGGQKQRLALARALLCDSPVYIFDEATSNIDIESEETVLEQILKLAESRTVIMISHRLANLAGADWIYVMDGGRVAESGSHRELLDRGGVYARLWRTQQALESYGREAV